MQQNFTDPRHLAEKAYRDGTQLRRRKALYQFMTPRYDFEEEVIKLLDLRGNEILLDVGCGAGELLLKIAQRYPAVSLTGVDISPGIFAPAQEQARQRGFSIQFQTADAQSLLFPAAYFDRVTALHMLYHVPDIEKALREMKRVLKLEGRLVVSTNSLASKPELQRLGSGAAQHIGIKEHAPVSARFPIESGEELLRRYFRQVELTRFQSTITLYEPKPGVEYFDSMRDLWDPRPSDAQWQAMITFVQQQFESIIQEKGKFEDRNIFGIFVASDSNMFVV